MRDRVAAPEPSSERKEESAAEEQVVTGEMRVRALSFGVFSGGMNFADFKFIQDNCMRSVAIISERGGSEFPMPLVTGDGVWTPEGQPIADDIGLVMRLTTEVLVFCFSDFFAEGGHGMQV